ncbi:39S ribosomal protein L17, mitochondrial isoform X1 [Falco naumanni]|uniref:39S ribosomal protein L17, mitochondrial isoform X1 n=1 Tax=Falco naumanni TaxID=148594 RepID=UPI001ADE25C2|nr:39S ribosomal protein L17, mitochondrial isoform X1 [Falco naumanni]
MRLSAAAAISHGRVYRKFGLGPRSRLDLLRNLVTALVRHERIEAPWARADEMRGYAERVSGRDGTGEGRGGRPRGPDVTPFLLPAAHRVRQAGGHQRACHAHGRFLADGEGPHPQAVQGAGTPVPAPPRKLHPPAAHPQPRWHRPCQDGSHRAQGEPLPATHPPTSRHREDAAQPATEGLPGGHAAGQSPAGP